MKVDPDNRDVQLGMQSVQGFGIIDRTERSGLTRVETVLLPEKPHTCQGLRFFAFQGVVKQKLRRDLTRTGSNNRLHQVQFFTLDKKCVIGTYREKLG